MKRLPKWLVVIITTILMSGSIVASANAVFIPERVSTAPIPKEYLGVFRSCAEKHNIDVLFMAAVFSAGEHGGRWPSINGPWASSHKGANGPWQFMPGTWRTWKKHADVDNPNVQNIQHASCAAAAYLASAGARGAYGDSVEAIRAYREASSRYNSGKPASVGETYYETRPYMASVVRSYRVFYRYYSSEPSVPSAREEPRFISDSLAYVSVPTQEPGFSLNLSGVWPWVQSLAWMFLTVVVVLWVRGKWLTPKRVAVRNYKNSERKEA